MAVETPPGTRTEDFDQEIPASHGMSDEDLKDFFTDVFSMADEVRRPRKRIWDSTWNLYNNQYDWSHKAEWQSKAAIPKVRVAVDRAVGTIRRALMRMRRFYHVESETRLGHQKGLFSISLMDFWLDRANWVDAFVDSLKCGLVTSTMALKVYWKWSLDYGPMPVGAQDPQQMLPLEGQSVRGMQSSIQFGERYIAQLGLEAINPDNLWIVPGVEDAYIERTWDHLGNIRELAKRGVYDAGAIEALQGHIVEKSSRAEEDSHAKGPENEQKPSKYFPLVPVYHYWGPIYDKDGGLVKSRGRFSIADKAVVIRKLQNNPFWHGRPPYVVGTPYKVPFSTYNRGMVEDIAGIAWMITELSNMIIDGAMFDAIRSTVVDLELLKNKKQIDTGLYPGKIWVKDNAFDPTGQRKLMENFDVGRVPSDAINTIHMLDREQQISTSVTELISGAPIAKGTRTASEILTKESGAQEGLDDVARTVEDTVLNPVLDLTARVIYQYHNNFEMPRLVSNFPRVAAQMQALAPEERYMFMVGGYAFRARGISVLLDKSQNLERITATLQMLANIPGALESIDLNELVQEILMATGMNVERLMRNPTSSVMPAVVNHAGGGGPSMLQALTQGAQLSPAQQQAGIRGAQEGGAVNNPQARGANLRSILGGRG